MVISRAAISAATLLLYTLLCQQAHASAWETYQLIGIPLNKESHDWSAACTPEDGDPARRKKLMGLIGEQCANLEEEPWRQRELNDYFAAVIWYTVLCDGGNVSDRLEDGSLEPFGRFCANVSSDEAIRAIRWMQLQVGVECLVYAAMAAPRDDPWWVRLFSGGTEIDDVQQEEIRTINKICHEFRRQRLDAVDARFQIREAKLLSRQEIDDAFYEEMFGGAQGAIGDLAEFVGSLIN